MVTSAIGPPPNTCPLAYLGRDLEIATGAAKSGLLRKDEYFETARNYYDCLITIRKDIGAEWDQEIFRSFYDKSEMLCIHVQTKLVNYCKKTKIDETNWREFIDSLIETNEGILEGKVVGDIERFEDVSRFLTNQWTLHSDEDWRF